MSRKCKIIIMALVIAALCATATLVAACNRDELETDNTNIIITVESFESAPVAIPENVEASKELEQTITYSDDVPLPDYLQEAMQQACYDYGVPYALALAVAECESSFDLEADSGTCWGVMQINPCNYSRLRELGIEPTEYEGNIVAGVFMLSELLDKYGDTHKALMAYNCGETGAKRLWDEGYYTSTYSRKVTTQYESWQQITNK